MDYGDWFVYVKEWEAAMESNDYNIHLLFFEDLKEVCSSCVDPEEGQKVRTPSYLENHKAIGFLSNTGSDPL